MRQLPPFPPRLSPPPHLSEERRLRACVLRARFPASLQGAHPSYYAARTRARLRRVTLASHNNEAVSLRKLKGKGFPECGKEKESAVT